MAFIDVERYEDKHNPAGSKLVVTAESRSRVACAGCSAFARNEVYDMSNEAKVSRKGAKEIYSWLCFVNDNAINRGRAMCIDEISNPPVTMNRGMAMRNMGQFSSDDREMLGSSEISDLEDLSG